MKLTDFNIIYINLKKRPDRLIYLEGQLKEMNLYNDAIYLEATDGNTMPEYIYKPIRDNFKTLAKIEERIIGRIGCYYSHLQALKMAIDNNFSNVLILEDDCQFLPGAERQESSIPNNADVIYLGGLFWRQSEEDALQTGEWVNIQRKHLKLACCLCYGIVGLDKMKEIYKILTTVRPSAIDLLYINHIQKKGNCYILNPVLCYQNHTLGSDVTSKGGNVQSFVKKKGAYFYTTTQEDILKGL